MKHLYDILMFWRKIWQKYETLKNDPQKCETSTSLGVTSLVMSIAGIVLTVVFAVLAYYCYTGVQTLLFLFAIIGTFACAFIAIMIFIQLVLASIVYAVYQLKLNKRTIGKVAIVVSLLISVLTIAAVIIALSLIPAAN